MRLRSLASVVVVALGGAGCESGPWTYDCTVLAAPFLPYDGERVATYVNRDPSVEWRLVMTKEAVEERDGTDVVTFAWTRSDTAERLGAMSYSAENADGVRFHGWQQGGDEPVWLSEPVALQEPGCPGIGSTVSTETDGITFVSTFAGTEDCPVPWGMAWEDCLHLSIDDGDGDDDAGPIFAGDWWLVTRYGPAWFRTIGYADVWELEEYVWSGDAR